MPANEFTEPPDFVRPVLEAAAKRFAAQLALADRAVMTWRDLRRVPPARRRLSVRYAVEDTPHGVTVLARTIPRWPWGTPHRFPLLAVRVAGGGATLRFVGRFPPPVRECPADEDAFLAASAKNFADLLARPRTQLTAP